MLDNGTADKDKVSGSWYYRLAPVCKVEKTGRKVRKKASCVLGGSDQVSGQKFTPHGCASVHRAHDFL
jgi:hypothetical protein